MLDKALEWLEITMNDVYLVRKYLANGELCDVSIFWALPFIQSDFVPSELFFKEILDYSFFSHDYNNLLIEQVDYNNDLKIFYLENDTSIEIQPYDQYAYREEII